MLYWRVKYLAIPFWSTYWRVNILALANTQSKQNSFFYIGNRKTFSAAYLPILGLISSE